MKIKRKVSPFSLPPPAYLPFAALLSLFFYILDVFEAAKKRSEIKVKSSSLAPFS